MFGKDLETADKFNKQIEKAIDMLKASMIDTSYFNHDGKEFGAEIHYRDLLAKQINISNAKFVLYEIEGAIYRIMGEYAEHLEDELESKKM